MSLITKEEILQAQELWGQSIVEVGQHYQGQKDYEARAKKLIEDLYSYNQGGVLFKPTLASKVPFRETFEKALSYFTGQNKVCEEDGGFAIKGWKSVRFENHQVSTEGHLGWAMGEYFFETPEGEWTKVEYTFGYKKGEDAKVRIFLHHSSLPFVG